MNEWADREIRPYLKGEEPLNSQRLTEELLSFPGWELVEREGIQRLEKSFRFRDFRSALDFANLVGGEAEKANHHPALLVSWGRTAVSWWTHAVNGLHENDLIMAARTDQLYQKDDPDGEEE